LLKSSEERASNQSASSSHGSGSQLWNIVLILDT
jgi:hypothetical protein